MKVNHRIDPMDTKHNINKSIMLEENLSDNGDMNNVEIDAIMFSEPKVKLPDVAVAHERIEHTDPIKKNIFNKKALSKEDTTYKLEKFKRNFLMIFNQEYIDGMMPRIGTDRDVKALEETFSKFGFEIMVYHDLRIYEIFRMLRVFEEKDFTEYGCVAIAVLTHGGNDGLLRAKDGRYNEIDLIKCFKTHNKPTLITKPKILIIQASRGFETIPGVYAMKPAASIKYKADEDFDRGSIYTLPVESDMLIIHSSFSGTPSFRDEVRGSWFIQTLCQKIQQFAAEYDLESIFTEVKRTIAIEFSHSEYHSRTGEVQIFKQMPVHTSTLLRKLYLRGFGDEPKVKANKTNGCNQCHCEMEYYSYMRNCLRYVLEANPDDKMAKLYLNISNTFTEGDEFNAPKTALAKAISEYLSERAKNEPYFKFIYMHRHGL